MALITFSGAAPYTKAREHKIRWTPRQRARRLCFVVNNSRFLVLPERTQYPNLASRVLALCLKQLNGDWQTQWGHPVVLVESYVDESQYCGICYRACGFAAVGLTAGCGRSSRDYYLEPGQPKQLYLRELRPRALDILRQGRLPADLAAHEDKICGPCPLRATQLGSLLEVFEQFKDPRRGHGLRHRQAFVLACAAVAMLMGAGGYEAFEAECHKLTQRQLRALGDRQHPKTHRSTAGGRVLWSTPPAPLLVLARLEARKQLTKNESQRVIPFWHNDTRSRITVTFGAGRRYCSPSDTSFFRCLASLRPPNLTSASASGWWRKKFLSSKDWRWMASVCAAAAAPMAKPSHCFPPSATACG